jgi:hypothetical protein
MSNVFQKQLDDNPPLTLEMVNELINNRRASYTTDQLDAFSEYISGKVGQRTVYYLFEKPEGDSYVLDVTRAFEDEIDSLLQDFELVNSSGTLPRFKNKSEQIQ